MNLFNLAKLEVKRENKTLNNDLIINKAVVIRKWLDKHRGVADKILAGHKVYQYGNRFICK